MTKGPEPIRRGEARFHLHRAAGYPQVGAVVFFVLGLGALFLPKVNVWFLATWPLLFIAIFVWMQLTQTTGKGVSLSADVLRLGDRTFKRADIDLVFLPPAAEGAELKLWFVAERGEHVGWFETDGEFAMRAMKLLAPGRARVAVKREGEDWRSIVEATAEGLVIQDETVTRYRWEDIRSIEAVTRGFVVRTKAGEVFNFGQARGHLAGVAIEQEITEAFVESSNELRAPSEKKNRPEVIARVTAALEGDGAFRGMPVERHDLWTVLESNAASVDVRLKAARLLACEGHNHARFRVASEWCAEPKVRVELEKLANQPEVVETSTPVFPEAQKRD